MAETKGAAGRSSGMNVDTKLVRELAELLAETGLTEIEVEDGERKVRVARGGVAMAAPAYAPAPAPAAVAPAPSAAAPATRPHAARRRGQRLILRAASVRRTLGAASGWPHARGRPRTE